MQYGFLLGTELTRKKGELLLLTIGIAFGAAAVFILFSLLLGVQKTLFDATARQNPLSEITVYGSSPSFLLSVVGNQNPKKLTAASVQEIENIPGVTYVAPHEVYRNFASVELELLGQKIQTDSLLFGAPRDVVKDAIENSVAWDKTATGAGAGLGTGQIPVVISRKLLDFYNLSLAPDSGLPSLTESTFLGTKITIFPGYSSFLGSDHKPSTQLTGKVVGFSDRVDLIGITIPIDVVSALNKNGGQSEESYNKLFVTIDSPLKVQNISQQLESRGYHVTSLEQQYKEIGTGVKYAALAVSLFSIIVITISLLLVGSTVFSSLMRRSKELGILRSMGATRAQLKKLFVLKYAAIGIFGGAVGVALGKGIISILQLLFVNHLQISSLERSGIFDASPLLMLVIVVVTTFLCAAVSLIPISKILRQTPKSLFESA